MPKSLKLLNPNDIDSELTYSACFMLRKIQRTRIGMLEPKSFYLSPAVGYFYECNAQHAHHRCLVPRFHNMKNQFWAVGCGLGWTVEKKGLGRL